PAGEISREHVVIALPEPMDVGEARQIGFRDLYNWPDHDERPAGPGFRDFAQEVQIKTFIYDAEISELRPRDRNLIGGLWQRAPCGTKMRDIYARGERVDIVMPMRSGSIKRAPARKHQIGRLHQLGLSLG